MNPTSNDPGSQSSLRELRDIVRRHVWTVLGVTLASVALIAAYTFHARPRYDSVATLRIEGGDSKSELLSQLMPVSGMGLPSFGDDEIDTEIGVLRSRTIADEVAERTGLHVELLSPRVERNEVLRVIRAPATAPKGRFTLRLQADGSYAVTRDRGTRVRLPGRVRIGEPFSVGEVTLVLEPSLRGAPPEQVRFAVRSFRKTVEDMREDLQVSRDGGSSKLLEVSYLTTDPELSAAVVNGVADAFVRYKMRTARTESRSTVDVLNGQIELYAGQLRDAEARLQRFQESARVIAPQAQAEAQVRRLAEMQVRNDAMQVERASLVGLLQQVRQRPAGATGESPYRQLATFPSFISNGAIQEILETLNTVEGERSLLLQRRTEEDPDVRQLTGRIADLEDQLHRIASNYLGSLDAELRSSSGVLGSFQGELAQIPATEIEYMRLAREQKLLSEVYLMLQTRLKEAEVQNAVDRGIVRLVDAGLVAEEPHSPKPAVNLILATVLGLMLGFTAAFGRAHLDTTVRSRADAEQASKGLVVLGTIPRITPARGQDRNGRLRISLPGRKVVGAPEEVLPQRLVTRSDPQGPAAEAYRALRTSITFAGAESPLRVLVVTSALSGDGKSTNAVNLAATMAQQGTRVLLVDADLRRGLLHAVLGARQEPGLAQVIRGAASLDDALQAVELGGDGGAPLYFLGTGGTPSNPAELLGSQRMRDVVAELRARFEMVIFDAPPMNLVTDAAVLGALADSTVMVARNGTTERASLEHAVTQLRNLRVPVGGVVLNDYSEPGLNGYAVTYARAEWGRD
jgi:capsular exopolysaccharide synthesis family protein